MGVTIDQLKGGAKSHRCGEYLSRCEELYRQQIYTSLEHERLTRKYSDILHLLERDGLSNWNQTFYLLLMRTLGDELNKEVFMEVARRVPLRCLLRERGESSMKLEALLVGASGFLDSYPNQEYLKPLKMESRYLLHKHNIPTLSFSHWDLGRVRPLNHPVVRLSQVATLFNEHEFIFSDMLLCETRRDVDTLFSAKSSQHLLNTHPYLTHEGQESINIGAQKRSLIGINLVVPMMYAYGCYTNDDDLCAKAQDLNERLPAESNRYVKNWREKGVNPTSAFESQALIQLETCYCKNLRCEECPVGRHIIKGTI